jgi:hypothetical protein
VKTALSNFNHKQNDLTLQKGISKYNDLRHANTVSVDTEKKEAIALSNFNHKQNDLTLLQKAISKYNDLRYANTVSVDT